jgi:CheY-like chemotaxis protein
MTTPATILIVDDIDANRNVLHNLVDSIGHHAITAENGLAALAILENTKPDMILLDILMPEMDGYDVLKHLKSTPELLHIPVLMISAVDEMESVISCIEQGADDYLVKPFNRTLLRARIRSCLDKKRLRDKETELRKELADYNIKLETRIQAQTRELEAAYSRLSVWDSAKSDFLRLISYELDEPLKNLLGPAELVFRGGLSKEQENELKQNFRQAVDRLQEFVRQAALLADVQIADEKTLWLKSNPLNSILHHALEHIRPRLNEKRLQLAIPEDHALFVASNFHWLSTAISSLLRILIKHAQAGGDILVTLDDNGDSHIRLIFQAQGHTFKEEQLKEFFTLFSEEGKGHGGGGFDGAIAERIIVLCGGSVNIRNAEPPGLLINVVLKRGEAFLV